MFLEADHPALIVSRNISWLLQNAFPLVECGYNRGLSTRGAMKEHRARSMPQKCLETIELVWLSDMVEDRSQ